MLGSNVSVLTYRKEQALGVKEEYHSFRNRFAAGVVLLPTLLMLSMKWADSRLVNGETDRLAPAVMAGGNVMMWVGFWPLDLWSCSAVCVFDTALLPKPLLAFKVHLQHIFVALLKSNLHVLKLSLASTSQLWGMDIVMFFNILVAAVRKPWRKLFHPSPCDPWSQGSLSSMWIGVLKRALWSYLVQIK